VGVIGGCAFAGGFVVPGGYLLGRGVTVGFGGGLSFPCGLGPGGLRDGHGVGPIIGPGPRGLITG